MSNDSRRQALEAAGLAHPRPQAVTSPLFGSGDPFFFSLDKVQVKYEMLGPTRSTAGPSPRRLAPMVIPGPSSTWSLPVSRRPA